VTGGRKRSAITEGWDYSEKTYEDIAREETTGEVGQEPNPSRSAKRVFFTGIGFIFILQILGFYFLNPRLWVAVLILCAIVFIFQHLQRRRWLAQCQLAERRLKEETRGF
jgi:hypothetical protein